jgi:flagellar biosynthetic protein FlhB
MAQDSFQDKTEPATPRRREEARKKGQVPKSKELSSTAILAAGLLYLFFCGKRMTMGLGNILQQAFSDISLARKEDYNILIFLKEYIHVYLSAILPMLLTLSVMAILANYLQTGFIWSVEALAPKASKIDPIQGAKKLLSKRSLVELAKSVAKIVVVGWAAFSALQEDFKHLIPLIYQEEVQIMSFLGQISMKVVTRCCWVIAILAVLDYIYQKWESEQSLKMTKQEVKDEFKQTEGDPHVKARIRSIQRQMARKRMMEEVPKADVVITNPVHLAVALRYNPAKMTAPAVVAKGANKVAFRIREVAEENRVPVLDNKELAQNLYKLEIGEEIPSQFYQAVAEILAHVYRLKQSRHQQWG